MANLNHPRTDDYHPLHDPDPVIRRSAQAYDDRGWFEPARLGMESELSAQERAFRDAVTSAHAILRNSNIVRDAAELAFKDATRIADRRREELTALLDNLPPQSPKS